MPRLVAAMLLVLGAFGCATGPTAPPVRPAPGEARQEMHQRIHVAIQPIPGQELFYAVTVSLRQESLTGPRGVERSSHAAERNRTDLPVIIVRAGDEAVAEIGEIYMQVLVEESGERATYTITFPTVHGSLTTSGRIHLRESGSPRPSSRPGPPPPIGPI